MEDFKKKLNQGDIIMYHSHDWISNFVSKLTNVKYTHCSIYDKDGFLFESLSKSGLVKKTIEESIHYLKTDLITIYRVKNLPPEHSEKLIETIKSYKQNKFANAQSLLLIGILWKQKQNFNFALKYLTNFILLIFETFITRIWDTKNKNMICSELVYRTYMDTAKALNDPNFVIHIPIQCNSILYNSSKNNLEDYPCDSNISSENFIKNSIETIKGFLDDFLDTSSYNVLSFTRYSYKSKKIKDLERKTKKVEKILKRKELYNFITPGDLVRSLDTYPVATYKTQKALKNTSCKLCVN